MATRESVDWDAVAAIRSSKRRKQVIDELIDGPKYAKEIAEDVDDDFVNRDMVTNQLRWLKNNDLAECLTPERPHHRIYGLTDEGKAVAEEV